MFTRKYPELCCHSEFSSPFVPRRGMTVHPKIPRTPRHSHGSGNDLFFCLFFSVIVLARKDWPLSSPSALSARYIFPSPSGQSPLAPFQETFYPIIYSRSY